MYLHKGGSSGLKHCVFIMATPAASRGFTAQHCEMNQFLNRWAAVLFRCSRGFTVSWWKVEGSQGGNRNLDQQRCPESKKKGTKNQIGKHRKQTREIQNTTITKEKHFFSLVIRQIQRSEQTRSWTDNKTRGATKRQEKKTGFKSLKHTKKQNYYISLIRENVGNLF